jgi:sigma-B regulation protein RsbU (phosphoserine phosphatase)
MHVDETTPIRILLVEDNRDFAQLVEVFLRKHDKEQFVVSWRETGSDAIKDLQEGAEYDIILMDYFLPGQNGLEVTRALQSRGVTVPIVFLTANKDFELAVEVMKLGIEDYLVKDEISTPVLPRTILNVIERDKLRKQLSALEIMQKRLEAIQEMVQRIALEIRTPLEGMRVGIDALVANHTQDHLTSYLTIISDNVGRIERKIGQLKDLKSDRTVPYIKDIRMIDLSGR